MYERYYGLRELPFRATTDPRFLLLMSPYAEALSVLDEAVQSRRGIVALVGETGTGKTTILRAFLASSPATGVDALVLVDNPLLTRAEFIETLALAFGLSVAAQTSKPKLLAELTHLLNAVHEKNGRAALVIDEAHTMSDELLEEIRLLSNLENATARLLSVVLVGQPELGHRLNRPSLRQLKQRVTLRAALRRLEFTETASYIAARLQVAGGDVTTIFTPDAIAAIHDASHGLPRAISVIADNALITGLAAGERPVGAGVVMEVCRDLDLDCGGDPPSDSEPMAVAGADTVRWMPS